MSLQSKTLSEFLFICLIYVTGPFSPKKSSKCTEICQGYLLPKLIWNQDKKLRRFCLFFFFSLMWQRHRQLCYPKKARRKERPEKKPGQPQKLIPENSSFLRRKLKLELNLDEFCRKVALASLCSKCNPNNYKFRMFNGFINSFFMWSGVRFCYCKQFGCFSPEKRSRDELQGREKFAFFLREVCTEGEKVFFRSGAKLVVLAKSVSFRRQNRV